MALGDVLIELSITKSQNVDTGKYNLLVKVTIYQNIQAQIFVFKRDLTTDTDFFSHVASPAELTSLPKHHHEAGNLYFLEHTVNLEFDTVQTMNDTESMILTDVNQLKKDWGLIKDQLDVSYKVVI